MEASHAGVSERRTLAPHPQQQVRPRPAKTARPATRRPWSAATGSRCRPARKACRSPIYAIATPMLTPMPAIAPRLPTRKANGTEIIAMISAKIGTENFFCSRTRSCTVSKPLCCRSGCNCPAPGNSSAYPASLPSGSNGAARPARGTRWPRNARRSPAPTHDVAPPAVLKYPRSRRGCHSARSAEISRVSRKVFGSSSYTLTPAITSFVRVEVFVVVNARALADDPLCGPGRRYVAARGP